MKAEKALARHVMWTVFSVGIWFTTGGAHAEEKVAINEQVVLDLALRDSHQVQRAEARLDASEAAVDRATYAYIPRLEFSFRYTRLSEVNLPSFGAAPSPERTAEYARLLLSLNDPNNQTLWGNFLQDFSSSTSFTFPQILNQFSLSASLTWPISDLLFTVTPAREAAEAMRQARTVERTQAKEDVAYKALEAYYQFLKAKKGAEITAEADVLFMKQRERVKVLVDAQALPRVELLRLEAQVSAARVQHVRAEGMARLAERMLKQQLHLDANAVLEVNSTAFYALDGSSQAAEVMPAELRSAIAQNDGEALLAYALKHRNDLKALSHVIQAQQASVRLAEGSRLPHLALAGNAYYQNPNQRIIPNVEAFRESWDLSAVITWSPNDLLSGERSADEQRAALAETLSSQTMLEEGVELQIQDALTSYHTARASIAAASLGQTAASESFRIREMQLEQGTILTTDLIEATLEQSKNQLDLLSANIDLKMSELKLKQSLGLSLLP